MDLPFLGGVHDLGTTAPIQGHILVVHDVLQMPVGEAVKFFEHHRKIHRTLDTLNSVGLSYIRLGQPATTLSGGEAQRVKLASELRRPPHKHTVYILDEPTTGLDPNQMVEIRNLIKDIGKEKIVLLSTHILQEIPKICNHIIIINEGKIVENIKMDELVKSKINLEDHFRKLTA